MSAAVLNAISDESTACEAPSLTTQRMPTTGKPMSVPLRTPSWKPLSHAEMNSRGIEPPVDVVDELVGLDRVRPGAARCSRARCAYWPEPPVCFLCV